MDNNYLQHYGVLGMRWGVRKDRSTSSSSKKKKKLSADDKQKMNRKRALKNRRTLSDSEIKSRIDRLKMEKELKNLTEEDISPGKKATKEILSSAGKKVAATVAAGAAAYAVKVAMTKKFDIKEAAAYVAANPNKKK